MKIIDQYHEILDYPKNPLQLIEIAGRNCYQSQDKIGCIENHDKSGTCPDMKWNMFTGNCNNTNCSVHSSNKFTKMLKDKGHHAMLEFGDISVRFVTNRGVLAELSRHRLLSLAVESTRYVRLDNNMEFIRPVWWEKSIEYQKTNWEQAVEMTEHYYLNLLNAGWKPEQAREILPNSLKTEIICKANYREWLHILKLRTSKKAHPQIRALILPLLAELQQKIPVIFDDIGK